MTPTQLNTNINMDLRDWFAGQALTSLISQPFYQALAGKTTLSRYSQALAVGSYAIADAMLYIRHETGTKHPDAHVAIGEFFINDGLDTKIITALYNHDIRTLGDLLNMNNRSFTRIPNIGQKSLAKITEAMDKHNLKLHGTGVY